MLRKFYKVKVIYPNSKYNVSRKDLSFSLAVSELMKHKDKALYGEIYTDKEGLVATLENGQYNSKLK